MALACFFSNCRLPFPTLHEAQAGPAHDPLVVLVLPSQKNGDSKALTDKAFKEVASRGWEGAGSQGTELRFTVKAFRVMCIITQVIDSFCGRAGCMWLESRLERPVGTVG